MACLFLRCLPSRRYAIAMAQAESAISGRLIQVRQLEKAGRPHAMPKKASQTPKISLERYGEAA
jgi:hypothetical protein